MRVGFFANKFTDTPQGGQLLKNFAVGICGADQKWSMSEFIGREIKRIRDLVGPTGQVLGAVSGGVDSTVAGKFNRERDLETLPRAVWISRLSLSWV